MTRIAEALYAELERRADAGGIAAGLRVNELAVRLRSTPRAVKSALQLLRTRGRIVSVGPPRCRAGILAPYRIADAAAPPTGRWSGWRRPHRTRAHRPAEDGAPQATMAEDAAARLAEIPPDTRSLTGRLMGDPIPGDRRRRPFTSAFPPQD